MVDTFYNPLTDGPGLEGLLSWSNTYSEGWFSAAFLVMIWIVSTYVLSKSEWKMSNVVTFSSLLVFLLSVIMSLFLAVNGYLIFASSVVFIVGLVFSIINRG